MDGYSRSILWAVCTLAALSLEADTVTNGQVVARSGLVQTIQAEAPLSIMLAPSGTNIAFAWELWNVGTHPITLNGISNSTPTLTQGMGISLRAITSSTWSLTFHTTVTALQPDSIASNTICRIALNTNILESAGDAFCSDYPTMSPAGTYTWTIGYSGSISAVGISNVYVNANGWWIQEGGVYAPFALSFAEDGSSFFTNSTLTGTYHAYFNSTGALNVADVLITNRAADVAAMAYGAVPSASCVWRTNTFIATIHTNDLGAVTGIVDQAIIYLGKP